jgi:hypothetical protein
VVSAAERHVARSRASRGRFRRRLRRRCAHPVDIACNPVASLLHDAAVAQYVWTTTCNVRSRARVGLCPSPPARGVCPPASFVALRLTDAPGAEYCCRLRPRASGVVRVDSCADRRARGCVEHCGDVLRLDDDIDSFMARDAAGATPRVDTESHRPHRPVPRLKRRWHAAELAFCSVEYGAVVTAVRSWTKRR